MTDHAEEPPMDNSPFDMPAPENEIARVHDFARDLAYGATRGLWHTKVQWNKLMNPEISRISKVYAENLRPKWGTGFPSAYLLLSFGYLTSIEGESAGHAAYLLTEKAFKLLERPAESPGVFISYRRGHSTALALYLEMRLHVAGNHNVFVDKALEPGSQWRNELETKVRGSQYLVLLATHGTFDSAWVMKEIDIAQNAGSRIIPVLHPAGREPFRAGELPQVLDGLQAIRVQDATAAEYETTANKLLSFMGYSTL
ncbi:MAG: toll/interleukin-1 receptor domain-containing protein [Chloroflexota bacterium]